MVKPVAICPPGRPFDLQHCSRYPDMPDATIHQNAERIVIDIMLLPRRASVVITSKVAAHYHCGIVPSEIRSLTLNATAVSAKPSSRWKNFRT